MSTIVTMTLDELKNLPPLTEDEQISINKVQDKKNTCVDDLECPIQSKEDLAKFRPLKEVNPEFFAKLHPELYKPKKADLHMKIDADVLEWFKAQGKGYQTKINEVLRAFVLRQI